MIETIHPKNEEEWLKLRLQDITSSEVAALFGLSSYVTEFELFHRKRDAKVVIQEASEWTRWGQRLQDSIAAGVAEDNGWNIRKMTEYMRDPELRMGASFDFSIEDSRRFVAPVHLPSESEAKENPDALIETAPAKGLLEIKNVFGMIFKDQWLEDEEGNLEAPPHIELQVQHQLAVSGRSFAYIAALVGGNQIKLIKREPNEKIISAIKEKVAAFWYAVKTNAPPKVDFSQDADFISSLYGYAEPGKVFDARGNDEFSELCRKHKELGDAAKAAEAAREAIKTRLLLEVKDAEKVIGDGFTISATTVGPADISYRREGYRMFRLNWPRKKKGE